MPMARAPMPKIVGLRQLDRSVRPLGLRRSRAQESPSAEHPATAKAPDARQREPQPFRPRPAKLGHSIASYFSYLEFVVLRLGLVVSCFLPSSWFLAGGGSGRRLRWRRAGGLRAASGSARAAGPSRPGSVRAPRVPGSAGPPRAMRIRRLRGRDCRPAGGSEPRPRARRPGLPRAARRPRWRSRSGIRRRIPPTTGPRGRRARDRSREATTVGRSRGNTRNWCSRRDQVREAGRTPRNGRRRNPNSGSRRRGCQRR